MHFYTSPEISAANCSLTCTWNKGAKISPKYRKQTKTLDDFKHTRLLPRDVRHPYCELLPTPLHAREYVFSLHYCYVKITIFHPVVSKIKLRFYLKPGNREPMFECWDESGSEHPDSAGRSLSFPQPTRSWATGQPISTLYSFTDCESQGYS